MTEWDITAIQKMEKVILFDGYMFRGKEEYNHCGKHMEGYFEMGYQDGEKIWRGTVRSARALARSLARVMRL